MSNQLGSSHLQSLFDAALQDYKTKTGIALDEHPFAEELQNCDSVESLTAVLNSQTEAFNQFRGKDKILKPLKNTLSVLHKLSVAAKFGQDIGLHFSPVTAIQTGLSLLLSAAKGVIDDYDALGELLESIDQFLNRLEIYTKIPPTVTLTEINVKILVELLSTLALTTRQIKQGKTKKFAKKFFGDKNIEAVLKRLDRLTQDEARNAAAQTLEVVYGLVQNMAVVMDNGKASVDGVRNALKTIQHVASDLNKSKQQDIYRWLNPPDPWKNHHLACDSRHHGSAAWFIEGNTFLEWKTSGACGSLLWVHGKPGAGKSVLCSTIIEDIDGLRKDGLASLGFFYCDFREDEKKDLRGLLSSFLVQLCHQSGSYCDMLSIFYSDHANGLRRPSDGALAECLKDLLKLPGLAPIYLIVDALEECPNTTAFRSPRAKVLNLIEELVKSQIPNLHVCVTSRPEPDIKDTLDPLIFRFVCLHDNHGQKKDIEEFIKSVIYANPENEWDAKDMQRVFDVLTERSEGMFRWVKCQVDYICGCPSAGLEDALTKLPDTLDETYQRTLRGIKDAKWEFAHRMFQFVAVAVRPLRVDELADLLAFDFKAGLIPNFRKDWRRKDPVHAVLSTCSSLLVVVDQYGIGKVIQFSHFSVKEFLTSTRLAKTSDILSHRYHFSMTSAHTLASKACLGILLHFDKDVVTRGSLKDFPLVEYAAKHWIDHVRFEDVSQNVEDGLKQLFDPGKPHLTVCVWIHDPVVHTRSQTDRAERPLSLTKSHYDYAVFWGLDSVQKFLVIELRQDVRPQDSTGNDTPSHHERLLDINIEGESPNQPPKMRALLVAITYHDSTSPVWTQLDSPHVDVTHFQNLLIRTYGYLPEDIVVLKDDPALPEHLQPTRANMIHELKHLVSGAAPGDEFIFLYSGHSDLQPSFDDIEEEEDGQDEVIITCDLQRIIDNELKYILVKDLPVGCSLFAILDTCHSGNMLDLPHYHCNNIYVPWVSKGNRRTNTMQNKIVRGHAFGLISRPGSGSEQPSSIASMMSSQPLLTNRRELSVEADARDNMSVLSPMRRCESPISLLKCDGWCDYDLIPRATAVSLSACADLQRAWEGPWGPLTPILCEFLEKQPSPSYGTLMSHVNFQLHANCRALHRYVLQKKTEARDQSIPQAAHPTIPSPSGESEDTLEWGEMPGFNGELNNFQAPQLSSLSKLNMDDTIPLSVAAVRSPPVRSSPVRSDPVCGCCRSQ